MYARLTMFQTHSTDKLVEGIHLYHDAVIPAARKLQSFKGGILLTDQNANKGYVITMWETEADMLTSETNGHYQMVLNKIASLISAPVEWGGYEVTGLNDIVDQINL